MISLRQILYVLFIQCMVSMPARAQIVGSNAFLKGTFVEIGVNQCGAYGSSASSPAGYHPTMAGGTLGFVADDDGDGWTGGTYPPYCGDYFLPGSPVEGWGIQIGASTWFNTDQYCSPFGIPGSITSYTSSGDTIRVVWEGNITSESVSITQTTELILDKSYFVTYVTICNNAVTTKNNVYYKRNVDPDNDQPWSGSFVTANTIVYQPPADAAALVTSTGTTYGCFLGMGSLAENSRVSWGNFSTTTGTPSDVYNATGGFSGSGSSTGDIANSIAFYHNNIPAGDCVCFAFAYILNEDQLDEALDATTGAAMWVDGEPTTPGTSVVVCEPGTPVEISISVPEDYSFTWSPSGIFDVDTGFTVTAYPTTTTTVTGTGIGDCGNMTVELTLTVADPPTITLEDLSICEGDASTIDLTAIAGETPCDPLTFTNSTLTSIPDGVLPPVSIPLEVTGVFPTTFSTAMFEEVCLSINHTFDADLDITLDCPDGTSIILSSDNGGSGDNYTNTCFVASGAPSVTGGTAPFTGTYTPEGSFAAFAGCTVNGTWILTVNDDLGAFTGSVLNWSISFVCENDFVSYEWSPATGLSDITIEDPLASPDTTSTYTVTLTDMIGCTFTEDVTVTVAEPSTAIFSYPLAVYCTDDADPDPVLDPDAASGTWSSSPAGLVINTMTGIIDLSVTVPGTYTITNNVTGPGSCPDATATSTITVAPSYAFTVAEEICSGETYILPDGSSVSTGGTYVTNLLTTAGCDSVITTMLTEHASVGTTADVSICSGDIYTLPDGTTVTTAGSYISTLASLYGCDSVITTNLSTLSAVSTDFAEEICDGDIYVLPDGSTTTSAGIFTFTFISSLGCDSIVTLDLTVHPVSSVSEDVSICEGTSYVLPDGSTVTSAGTYVSVLSDVLGCDSLITTNIVVDEGYSANLTPSICADEVYVLPDGTSTSTAGTYDFTFVSAAGCDSLITVDLTVNAVATSSVTAGICEGENYTLPDGTEVTGASTYVTVLSTMAGCDSTITTDLSVFLPVATYMAESMCDGESYVLPDGTTTTLPDTYTFYFISADGCDSTVTVNLSVNSINSVTADASICEGGSYVLPDGTVVTTAGTYVTTLTDALGCDSIITTNLTVTDVYSTSIAPDICEGDTYTLPDGTTTSSAGIYSFTFLSALGCDSIVNVDLGVEPIISITIDTVICEGVIYDLPDGTTADTEGTFITTLTSAAGCDSIITTNLSFLPALTTTLTPSICAGDLYVLPDGSTTTDSGTYVFVLAAVSGCDSLVTIELTVEEALTSTTTSGICDGDSYLLPDGTIISTGGSYTTVLTAVSGCDSIVTTDLTVYSVATTNLTEAICESETYVLPDGSSTSGGGSYTYTFPSASGCDSVVTVDLTVHPEFELIVPYSICEGETIVLPDGSIVVDPPAGLYTYTFTSVNGCDSIYGIDLTVNSIYAVSEDVEICDDGSYTLPDGSVVTTDGTYTSILIGDAGCDSIITTNLTTVASVSTSIAPVICDGDIYILPDGSSTTSGGTYSFTFTSALGCDSIVDVDLTVNSIYSVSEDVEICDGGTYTLPDGSVVTTDGAYTSTLTSMSGCDSIITTNLSTIAIVSTSLTPVICDGDTYVLPDGSSATIDSTYSFTFTSALGCDSIVDVDLTVNSIYFVSEDVVICDGGTYTLPDGSAVTTDGTYTSNLTSMAGCDSVITTNLSVTDIYLTTLTPTICDGDTYTLPDGSTTATSGTYSFTYVSALGCDSIVDVDLTVNSIYSVSEDAEICDGDTYSLPDGTIVSTGGTYTSTLTSMSGCDSIVTTNLSVTDIYLTTLTPAICEGDTYTLPDGSTIADSGTYSFIYVSALGCDSIVDIDLTVNSIYAVSEDVEICDGGTYTLPDGSMVSISGTYTSTLTSDAGCDSIITTNLSTVAVISTSLTPVICDGDTYVLPDGSSTASGGTYSFTFTSVLGCDSIVDVDLTVNSIYAVSEDVEICEGVTYTLPDGTIVTTDGAYTSNLTSMSGCDSVITTNLSTVAVISTSLTPVICDGDTYVLPDGSSTASGGTYTFTFTSALGCDSIVDVDLTVNSTYAVGEDVEICDGGTYTLPDGTIVSTDGTYTSTLTSMAGCDSVITTNLAVTDIYLTTLTPAICDGDTYTLPDGSTTSTSGTYSFTYVSALGCDSIVDIDLTVNGIYTVSEDVEICDGGTYTLPDGSAVTTDGIYTSTLTSMTGCDSIITTNLSTVVVISTSLTPVICDGDTYTLPDGSTTTTSGTYSFTYVSALGCDSIVDIDLTVNSIFAVSEDVEICEGGTYTLPDGTIVSTGGTYTSTLTSMTGCDSVITTNLSTVATVNTSLTPVICDGDTYTLPDGSSTSTGGTFTFTFTSALGCDSIVDVDLTVNSIYSVSEDVEICEGGTYTLPDGTIVSMVGTYTSTLTSMTGCDSIITTNLAVTDIYLTTLTASICDGDTYTLPDGSTTNVAGSFSYSFVSGLGCDSIVTVDLTVNEVYENIYPYAICDDETVILPDGSVIYDPPAGIYTYTFTTTAGCDSVVGIDLVVLPIYDELIMAEICDGGMFMLPDGTSTGTAGSYAFDLTSASGCDSLVTIELNVLPVFETIFTDTICNGEFYLLPDGSTTGTAGTYVFNYTGATGCDSVVTIDIEVLSLPEVDVWMDTTGYCMDAGWQTISMEPAGGILGGAGIIAGGFDPMMVGSEGLYDIWYTYTDADGCTDTAWTTIETWPLPQPDLSLPDGLCIEANPLLLNGTPPGGVYSGEGVSGNEFLASIVGAGNTWVVYTYTDINGCTGSVNVPIEVWENTVDAGVDLSLIAGHSIQLLIEGSGTISWSPGYGLDCTDCFNPVAFPLQTTTYTVTELDEHGCFATDEMTIFVEDLNDYTLFIPNTFTPNGDGLNDYFFINGFHVEDIIYFRVYDRWGEPVFDRENLMPGNEQQGWDGNFTGMPVSAGVYGWVAEILLANGERVVQYGNVTLIR